MLYFQRHPHLLVSLEYYNLNFFEFCQIFLPIFLLLLTDGKSTVIMLTDVKSTLIKIMTDVIVN